MGLKETLEAHLSERPEHISRRDDPHAYASEAGQCSRKIALRVWHRYDTPAQRLEEDPIRLSGLLALRIGEAVHESVQAALMKAYKACRVEVPWDLLRTSGRADGVYETQDGKLVVVEIKTKSPTQFDKHKAKRPTKATKAKPATSEAPGKPDFDNVLQAVLGALALDAQYVHIIYINKAARAFESPILEWIYPMDDELEESGLLEEQRMANIVEDAATGIIPEPMYHGEVLVNPDKHFWPCGFCPFLDQCKLIGPERTQLIRFVDEDRPAFPYTEEDAAYMATLEES